MYKLWIIKNEHIKNECVKNGLIKKRTDTILRFVSEQRPY